MKIEKNVTVNIEIIDKKLCSEECEFCYQSEKIEDGFYCCLFCENLKTNLDFDDYSKFRIERCNKCIDSD